MMIIILSHGTTNVNNKSVFNLYKNIIIVTKYIITNQSNNERMNFHYGYNIYKYP